MRLERLEPRDCPALVALPDVGGGYLRAPDGTAFRPFDDYSGPVQGVYSTNSGVGKVAPAPGSPGGPRVETVDARGDRQGNDYFAADPASRAGVAFVALDDSAPVQPPAPAPPPAVPAATAGGGRLTYYLDFALPVLAGLIPDPANYVPAAVARVSELLAPLDVTVTTVFPVAARPGSFVTGRVLTGPQVPWFNVAASGLTTETLAEHANLEQPLDVYAGLFAEPANTAHALAHEFGHAAGLPHRNVAGALMNGAVFNGGDTLDAAEVASANAAIDAFESRQPRGTHA